MDSINQLEHGVDKLLRLVSDLREENKTLKEALEQNQAGISEEVSRLRAELEHEKTIKDAVLLKVETLIRKLADIES